ncbi:hypothetical protein C8Q79DRAFT_219322 [Trametes meyenii]|nr:hypothetical protein C8Q79DRAFT_219322 [Trametes meyenii]
MALYISRLHLLSCSYAQWPSSQATLTYPQYLPRGSLLSYRTLGPIYYSASAALRWNVKGSTSLSSASKRPTALPPRTPFNRLKASIRDVLAPARRESQCNVGRGSVSNIGPSAFPKTG